ncbi:DNA packaging tegument protein UL25 [Columbid alphaherpesvirus 1]|uniref:DNA packaging tegument protein UL25 n=1 Tax=Columbid alphaherpesvirus 1 TaxID=93386 RepID=A0A1V0M8G0_9ALPH|nr:DNA packaging tegument protein UL25 [Columbid alphaherpesvirus 1]ARD71350.1 DNA packaging tegument protein UL25 [Columbid alphaherpesvirus 1]
MFAFDAMDIEDSVSVRIGDVRNFIAPPWPPRFWLDPVFNPSRESMEARLATATARNAAASAALDNLGARAATMTDEVDRRLKPLETQLMKMTAVLADLESAAAAAEMADAAADNDSGATAKSADVPDGTVDDSPRDVQIVKTDPSLRYDTNLPVDMLKVVYATRGASGSTGVVFGTWYRTLQESLVMEKPAATKRIDYQGGRISRTFVAAVVVSLQSSGRLYVGNRHYSALECALLCLYAFYSSTGGGGAPSSRSPDTFYTLIENTSLYLDHMATKISEEGTRPRYAFDQSRLPKGQFAASGASYERDALSGHSVLAALVKNRILPPAPDALPKSGVASEIDADQTAYADQVNHAAAALLGRAQPLFLMEDQTLLRATVDSIVAMLLLRRLLWNTNVYSDRTRNAFQLGAFIPGAAPGDQASRGPGGSTPDSAIKSDGRNVAFLFQKYVAPVYRINRDIELSQLFPGLVAVCLEGQNVQNGPRMSTRRILDVSAARSQTALLKLTALELENRCRTNVASVREVIDTHDGVTLQYERGLGALMQLQRPRASLFDSKILASFNVETDYDLHYFLCLGFVPKFTSAP